VIDEDYRGNLCVIVFNHSNRTFQIRQGDRVAQLICKVFYPDILEVKELNTERDIRGYGSTQLT
jgi:dUTP pyrophosphatase